MAGPAKKLKANTLKLTELARLEDLFLTSFEDALQKGIPDDAAGLKRLRHDLESILTEANKRTKLLSIELTKIYDMVSPSSRPANPRPVAAGSCLPAVGRGALRDGQAGGHATAATVCCVGSRCQGVQGLCPRLLKRWARGSAGLRDLLL